jgi:hypothetical protein
VGRTDLGVATRHRQGVRATPIERTGAATLASALCEWCAERAAVFGDDAARVRLPQDARRGYEEIGAPGHVERLAQELRR